MSLDATSALVDDEQCPESLVRAELSPRSGKDSAPASAALVRMSVQLDEP